MARVKVWLDGETLTASDLNAEFDNALASSLTPDTLDDVSGNLVEMQAVTDPYPAGAASLATTMRGEIQRLRYLLKQITGKSEWYVDPDTTLASISTVFGIDEQTVLGRVAGGTLAGLTQAQLRLLIFDSGTKMWFYQDTAPTGWTIVAAAADAVLAVKGGSNAYNAAGGTQAGTWTQPDHTLTTAETPAHTHGSAGSHYHALMWFGDFYGEEGYHVYAARQLFTTTLTGSPPSWNTASKSYYKTDTGGDHTHTSVGGGSAHNHGTTYRPLAQVGIICSKD